MLFALYTVFDTPGVKFQEIKPELFTEVGIFQTHGRNPLKIVSRFLKTSYPHMNRRTDRPVHNVGDRFKNQDSLMAAEPPVTVTIPAVEQVLMLL